MSSQNLTYNNNIGSSNKGSSEPSNNNIKQMAYRNLINENGYHSLLGGDREITSTTTNIENNELLLNGFSAGQLIDRMNRYNFFKLILIKIYLI
jgi:hypothetical protein